MSLGTKECKDIKARLRVAIEDEAKAGPEYQELASDVASMFCGQKCSRGHLARIGLQTLAIDENKHHDFLVQLLATVEQDCEEAAEKRSMLGPAPKEEEGIFGIKFQSREPGVELKLGRSSVPGEWVVRYYEDGKLNEDRSYYTNDKEDAEKTMEIMKSHIRAGA